VVDDLTGKKLGRASSGTFRTADVVGLDTMAHVIKTLQDNLSADTDPFYASFGTPEVLKTLLEMGNLGQKTKAGFYKKVGRDVLRFELESKDYVPGGQKADEVYGRMLAKPAAERLKLLRNAEGPQGQFLWAILRNSFHYAAVHLASIAETARDVDFAMRWGFGMKQGPFELWQEAGWLQVAQWIQEDIDAGKALSKRRCPDWVFKGPVADAGGVHTPQGSWNPTGPFRAAPLLPVHQRQHFPEDVLGSGATDWRSAGRTLHEDKTIRLWTLDEQVLIASLKTKMHAISPEVCEGPAAGGRHGREGLPGPGDLVGRRAVLGRRRPAGAAAGLHGRGRQRRRGRRRLHAADHAEAALCRACRWCPPSAAWRWAAAASWPCTRSAASPRWKATSAWWKSASAWCPAPAAWPTSRGARPKCRRSARTRTC
jgi:hypothetical protein